MKSTRETKTKKNKYQEGERVALPIHPGEILREEILIPRNISPQQLAQALKISQERIQLVYEEKTGITPDLARRLSVYFDTSVELWMNLQKNYEEEIDLSKHEYKKIRE